MPDRPTPEITSLQNPRVKAVAKLRDRRARDAAGRFLIDSRRDLDRAVAAGIEIETIYATELLDVASVVVSRAVLEKMSYRQSPDGLLAVAVTPPPRPLPNVAANDLILVTVGTQKPGNLGAMARAAAAAGCRAMVAAGPNIDLWNPNAIRNSTGAIFALPIAVAPEAEVLAWLGEQTAQAVAAVVHGSESLWTARMETERATVIIVGPEHAGLSTEWLSKIDSHVRIPQADEAVDSLNAATAAALLLFEVVRRRSIA